MASCRCGRDRGWAAWSHTAWSEQSEHDGPLPSSTALSVLDHVAARITELPLSGPRIAIDGPDGAGKTHFADWLAAVLHSQYHRHVVRVGIDHFHNTRELRYRQRRHSRQGVWEDCYNYNRFRSDVLEPFAPAGSWRYRRASYSHETDEVLYPDFETADPAAILVVDGIFLHRAELNSAVGCTGAALMQPNDCEDLGRRVPAVG